ncbi:hypothetical protein GWK47_017681 [Chionoecetes opilio]|uniref:Uncharacterized protein n=1 Tax=Chionoecetes opilio TaxID=41210 RepID=A0A8J4XTN5_CHIOP|nr:hypothetical protein GWK47_017681 [Chionoecetes opilio]
MDDQCFFDCGNNFSRLINCGSVRIETVRKCSVRRGDGLANKLVPGVETIRCHKSCVSTYTSEHHIQRYLFRQQATSTEEVPLKKSRRSGDTLIFREHCLFCGERCLPADPRNPSRWRTVIQCRTVDFFKQNILHKCDLRNDQLADNVRVRVNGALSDLHAADAQYHEDCYKTFTNHRNVSAAAGQEATQNQRTLLSMI